MKTKVLALFLLASSSMFADWRVGIGVGPIYVPPSRVYVAPPPDYVEPYPYVYGAPYSYYDPYPYVNGYVAPAPYGRGYWRSDHDWDRWRRHDGWRDRDRDHWRDRHYDHDRDHWRRDR